MLCAAPIHRALPAAVIIGLYGGGAAHGQDCNTNGTSDADDVAAYIQLLSVSGAGDPGNADSYDPAISADGRWLAFYSNASNLVDDDTNGLTDVFVKDLLTGAVQNIHRALDGAVADGGAWGSIDMTPDGRFVAFASEAQNLVAQPTAGVIQIFLWDRTTETIELVSASTTGEAGNAFSFSPALSADGRYVAFWSLANNLVDGDTNGFADVFRLDRLSGDLLLISTGPGGAPANGHSGPTFYGPSFYLVGSRQVVMTSDGRLVAFASLASNLVPDDTNGARDVFVHDCDTVQTERVSVSSAGDQGNANSAGANPGIIYPAALDMTPDGRFVGFDSAATNLDADDTNGMIDIFVRDRFTETTARVPAGGWSDTPLTIKPVLADDGSAVVFVSNLRDVVPWQYPSQSTLFFNVFRFDFQTNSLSLLSTAYSGVGADGNSVDIGVCAMAADGRRIAFNSAALNLLPGGPSSGAWQLYMRDLEGSTDCNANSVPDDCEYVSGDLGDCNTNAIADPCETLYDCNTNQQPDECDIASATSADEDADLVADECDNCPGLFNPEQAAWLRRDIYGNGAGGDGTSIQVSPSNRLAVTFSVLGTLALWHDDNGDLSADATEIRIIDTSGNAGTYSSLAFDLTGRTTVAYYGIGGGNLKLWHDADGDLAFDAGEIQIVDAPNDVGRYASLAFSPTGMAVVAYYDATNGDLRLWVDLNTNYAGDSGESRVIHATGSVGANCSLGFDAAGRVTVSHNSLSTGPLRLWHDANGDFAASSNELKTIDSANTLGERTSLAFDSQGRVAVAYQVLGAGLRLWHDSDGDFAATTSEIQAINNASSQPYHPKLSFTPMGRAMVAFQEGAVFALMHWHDANGNFAAEPGETQTVDPHRRVRSSTSLAFDPVHHAPAIAYRDNDSGFVRVAMHLDWNGDGICFADDLCPARRPGDVSGDWEIDALDVAPFVAVLLDPDAATPDDACAADVNRDGGTDGDDIGPFVALLMIA